MLINQRNCFSRHIRKIHTHRSDGRAVYHSGLDSIISCHNYILWHTEISFIQFINDCHRHIVIGADDRIRTFSFFHKPVTGGFSFIFPKITIIHTVFGYRKTVFPHNLVKCLQPFFGIGMSFSSCHKCNVFHLMAFDQMSNHSTHRRHIIY